jgi:hypothetical protein
MKVRWWHGIAFSLLITISCIVVIHHFTATRRAAQIAIETAQNSDLLTQAVGSPISMAVLVHGRVIGGDDGGTADLEIPVHGRRGKGTLFAWEQGDHGSWHVCSLSFRSSRSIETVIVPDESTHCERE